MDDYQRARIFRTYLLSHSADPNADVRDNIKEIMAASGMTQTELARKRGMTRQGINDVLIGKHVPVAKSLVPLAEVLGVDVCDLLAVRRPAGTQDEYATLTLRVPMTVLKDLIREGIITNG